MADPIPVGAVGSPATSRPRLGELLVQRGLLTPEQLGEALAEQQASGLPLGAILVRDGLVASHRIALLLAEQSGGPLKTEFGYALGAAPAEPVGAEVHSLRPPAAPAIPAVAPASEPVPPPAAAEVAVRAALEQKLADVEAGTEAALAGQAALERELAALHDRLAALELRSEELDAIRRSEARTIAERPYSSARHVLLAPVEDRYELVERPGPPPEAGSRIDLFDDRSFLVVRIGPAPIPGALEACAYLEPIPTRLPPPDADTEPT